MLLLTINVSLKNHIKTLSSPDKGSLALQPVHVYSSDTSRELVPCKPCHETKEAFLTKNEIGVHPYCIWKSSGYCDIQIWRKRLWKVSWLKCVNIQKIRFTRLRVKMLNFDYTWWRQWEHTLDDSLRITERGLDSFTPPGTQGGHTRDDSSRLTVGNQDTILKHSM